jgi:hypothetical protein
MMMRLWPGAVGTPYSSMVTPGKLCLQGGGAAVKGGVRKEK